MQKESHGGFSRTCHVAGCAVAMLLVMTAIASAATAAPAESSHPQPNFVVIMAEAQGWSSTSTAMDDANPASKSDLIQTPSLDRLCREGMRFANGYAASPRCTPSRVALLTGKSPAQLHMTFVGEGRREDVENPGRKLIVPTALLELPEAERTIAEILKDEGYVTAHFGKWHMGRVHPRVHGFDESDGATNNGGPENVNSPNPKECYGIADRGVAFMSRQVAAKKPFYLQISHYAGRGPEDALRETLAGVRARAGNLNDRRLGDAAVAEDADKALAIVLKKIDELGIAANTYVIYTADHGSQGRNANAPLTAGKGTIYEGGIRVPIIVRGPGIKAGVCSRVRASGVDLFATIAELSGSSRPLPKGVEGGSLAAVLKNGGAGVVRRARDEFVVHFPHYDSDTPASAMFIGDYKLIRVYGEDAPQLYDVIKDPAERTNLAKALPEKTAELDGKLTAYLQAVSAQMPKPNPAYDPKAAPELLRPGKP